MASFVIEFMLPLGSLNILFALHCHRNIKNASKAIYVFVLFEYSIIKKRCEEHDFNISMHKISDIITEKEINIKYYILL